MEEDIKNYLGEELCQILPDSFPGLYQRLCYEIMRFLDKAAENVLFLNLPVEELSNNTNYQDKYWNEICSVITLALRLSLKRENLNPKSLQYPGKWYHENDQFLLIPCDEDTEDFYYIQGVNNKLKFIWENRPGRGACAPPIEEKNNKITTAKAIYRLQSIPAQLKKGYITCCAEIDTLKVQSVENGYSSGMLICAPFPVNIKYAGNYISPVVEVLNSNTRIPRKDVVVIVGDKAFGCIQMLLNSLAPYGPTQKLIIIGSQPPQVLLQRSPKIITLTFKDMHDYCAPKGLEYKNPEFVQIEFPWLTESLSTLKGILERYENEIGVENARYIYNFSRKILADIDFLSERLDDFKNYFIDKVLENIANDEIFSALEKWAGKLSYDNRSNPKRDYAKKEKAAKVISLNRSIRSQLKGLRGNGNSIIIDAPLHKNDITYSNPITTVMRYHNFARIQCVYYEGIETDLKRFSSSNLKRDPLFQHQDNGDVVTSGNDKEEIRLEDYIDNDDSLNNFINRVYGLEQIDFTDGSSEYVTGDVLVFEPDETLTRASIKDIGNSSGLTIVYYSQNNDNSELFDRLVNARFKFPDGHGIMYYSGLWQSALKKLVGNWDKDSKKSFCNEMGISLNVLSNHIEGSSKFMRKKSLSKILKKLIDKRLLTETDAKYVQAARTFMNGNNISFGSQLKNALFEYKLNQAKKTPAFLNIILEKTGLKITDLTENFLNTKTIK